MPEQQTQEPPVSGFPDVAAHNEEVKQKLESQGREDVGSDPQDIQGTSDALDALAKSVSEKPVVEPVETDDEPTPEETPKETPNAEEQAAADKLAAEKAEAATKADEFFKDSPKLPPGASPKSSEAFAAIKAKAAQEISARDQQIEATKKELEEIRQKLEAGPDPETVRELEELRAWRAKLDVDADPKFKEFDKQVKANQDFIYAQLRKNPVFTPEIIAEIKKHGGPENVKLDKLFAASADPVLQRIVESKVADIEMAKFSKEEAIKTAKENLTGYQEERQKQFTESVGAHNKATQQHFSQLTAKLPWFVEKPVDPKADEPTRKAAQAHNEFLKTTKAQLDEALRDDSPEMRSILLAGMAQLLHLQNVRVGEKSKFDAATKELAEVKAKLEKYTKASTSRIRETGASPNPRTDTAPKTPDLEMHTGDALDNIAKAIAEKRARQAAA